MTARREQTASIILTRVGRDSRKNVFKSPPAKSSSTINFGEHSNDTPMNLTMFGCENCAMIKASIKKSIEAWFEESSGSVLKNNSTDVMNNIQV